MRAKNFFFCLVIVLLVLAGCVPMARSNETGAPWIGDELIVLGAKEDIRNLLRSIPRNTLRQTLATDPADPQPEAEFDITPLVVELLERQGGDERLRTVFPDFFGGRPLEEQLAQGIVVQRYRLVQELDLLPIIRLIDLLRNRSVQNEPFRSFKYFVYAEPNFWLTSLQTPQTCTSLSGQPNTVGNGPFGSPEASSATLTEFNDQWAFQRLAGLTAGSERTDPLTSVESGEVQEKVDVVIFDNSPYLDISGEFTNTSLAETRNVTLSLNQVMPLQVLHFPLGNQPMTSTLPDMDEHGVFVASLVHKVSPDSPLTLVRVLDETGCGASFTLNNALAAVAQSYSVGQKAVFNLSLGIPRAKIEFLPRMYLEGLLTNALAVKGIMMTAAAGNNQAASLLLPAGYVDDTAYSPYVDVVAVEASNFDGQRACFSNKGKDLNANGKSDNSVMAPGGDGNAAVPACPSLLSTCRDAVTCQTGILGVTDRKSVV